jgi:Putative metallopeptidase
MIMQPRSTSALRSKTIRAAFSACFVAFGTASAMAQGSPPAATPVGAAASAIEAKLNAAVKEFSRDPRFKGLSQRQIRDRVEFVAGNVIFATVHEVGHMVITELGLPVLGREEDAADSYAVVTMLKVGDNLSDNILIQSARGWFMSDARAKKQKATVVFYDAHGLDRQRAYNIVCLMVGSDPERFSKVADLTKMPEERQGTCQGDFSNASWSWEKALAPHIRKPDQVIIPVDVKYGETKKLEVFARGFKEIRLLEIFAEHISDRFVLRGPITLEMLECGEPNAHWDLSARKIFVCYELAADFTDLYRFGGSRSMSKTSAAERSVSRKR